MNQQHLDGLDLRLICSHSVWMAIIWAMFTSIDLHVHVRFSTEAWPISAKVLG